jgi:hypothetical protein
MPQTFFLAVLAVALFQTAAAGVPASSFRARQDYLAQSCTFSGPTVAVADTNGDGIPDLICQGLHVLFGNGDGTFRAGPSSNISYGAISPTVADLNGDGKVDLVVVASGGSSGPVGIGVSFGNGDGTFQNATFYQTGGDKSVTYIAIGDFNNDKKLDVAALGESGVWLFAGKGGGQFDPGVLTPLFQAQANSGLAASDLNHDGNLDLVAGAGQGFSVLLGNGNGTFALPVNYASALLPFVTFVAVGDLNGDGKLDVVATSGSFAVNYSLIYFGTGDGTLGSPQTVNLPSSYAAAIADLNGDRIPDLVNSNGDIVFGKGGGNFSNFVSYPIASNGNAYYVLAADLRNTDKQDLIFVNFYSSISVLLNQGRGVFLDGKIIPVTNGAYCTVSADFNRDGHPDLAVNVAGGISLLLGTGNTGTPFASGAMLSIPNAGCPLLADVNKDGILDIVLTSGPFAGPGSVVSFFGRGDGTFTQGPSSPIANIGALVLGDFNGDGKVDYASVTNLLGLGNGDGSFQTPAPFVPHVNPNTQATGFTSIAAGNLNGDRRTDIVIMDGYHYLLYVLIGNPAGGFQQTVQQTQSRGGLPVTPVIADVNSDGINDLVLGCIDSRQPLYLNDGTGKLTYSTTVSYEMVNGGGYPMVTDVNGDGIPDILVSGSYDIAVFLGQGSMTFASPFYLGHGTGPDGLLALNLHGQSPHAGKPDLVVPDAGGFLHVLFNVTQ